MFFCGSWFGQGVRSTWKWAEAGVLELWLGRAVCLREWRVRGRSGAAGPQIWLIGGPRAPGSWCRRHLPPSPSEWGPALLAAAQPCPEAADLVGTVLDVVDVPLPCDPPLAPNAVGIKLECQTRSSSVSP